MRLGRDCGMHALSAFDQNVERAVEFLSTRVFVAYGATLPTLSSQMSPISPFSQIGSFSGSAQLVKGYGSVAASTNSWDARSVVVSSAFL